MDAEKSSESIASIIKRAERRLGRPFLKMQKEYVETNTLKASGMRIQKDELYDEVEVWVLSFGNKWEVPTLVYGRTIPHAFQRAVYPEGRKKLRRNRGRSI